jgi:hypothetical protein
MTTAVHLGGAGTAGTGLRSGIPAVITTLAADQPSWARIVHQLGAGPARSSVGGTDQRMRRRAAERGAQVQAEDGPGRIEELFTRHVAGITGERAGPCAEPDDIMTPWRSAYLGGTGSHAESPDLEPRCDRTATGRQPYRSIGGSRISGTLRALTERCGAWVARRGVPVGGGWPAGLPGLGVRRFGGGHIVTNVAMTAVPLGGAV